MIRPAAAAFALAAVATGLSLPGAHAQGMILQIEVRDDNRRPVRPRDVVNTLQDLAAALFACWSPPPLEAKRQPLDLTFQVSFKRSGELFGKPRVVNFARPVTDDERQLYYTAVAEAVDRCAPMPFTESMGGAVAGRTFRVNFLDRRNTRKAEVSWLTTTTS
jgi:hypothetical protein